MQKPIITKIKTQKVYSSFKDNTWGADLTTMLLTSSFNKEVRFLLYIYNSYSKYELVAPLKKKCITITNAFKKDFH